MAKDLLQKLTQPSPPRHAVFIYFSLQTLWIKQIIAGNIKGDFSQRTSWLQSWLANAACHDPEREEDKLNNHQPALVTKEHIYSKQSETPVRIGLKHNSVCRSLSQRVTTTSSGRAGWLNGEHSDIKVFSDVFIALWFFSRSYVAAVTRNLFNLSSKRPNNTCFDGWFASRLLSPGS